MRAFIVSEGRLKERLGAGDACTRQRRPQTEGCAERQDLKHSHGPGRLSLILLPIRTSGPKTAPGFSLAPGLLGVAFNAENPHHSWDRMALRYEIAADGTFGVEYDNLGRITSLLAKYSGGGKLSTSYYVNDLTRSQTQGESPIPTNWMPPSGSAKKHGRAQNAPVRSRSSPNAARPHCTAVVQPGPA